MKCNPWRWLWGLIPILMLGWIAVLGERGRIEADLAQRAKTVLDRSGFGWANVAFDGRDAVLSGRAADESEPAKAMAAMLDTMGVRVVDNRAAVIEKVDRYVWSAERAGKKLRLDGFVPSEKARRDIAELARATLQGVEIEDRTKLARGSPALDVWQNGVGFGLKQLAMLSDGQVSLEQTSLTVAGDALDARSYRSIKGALANQIPRGITLKSEAVRPPVARPYVWSARRQGRDIVFAGHVPSEATRDSLMRAARAIAADVKVVDQMEPGSGAPDGFQGVTADLVAQLARLDDGVAQVRDRSATLTGTTETMARAEAIKAEMGRGTLAAFRTTGEIKHREPLIRTVTPYVTGAEVSTDGVLLSGYVPDDRARAAVTQLARERFQGRRIRDELQLGAGEPPGWSRCVEAGLDALQRLGNGKAALVGRRLEIVGTTDVEPLAQALPAEVRGKVAANCDSDVRVALDLKAIEVREQALRRTEDEARRTQAVQQQEGEQRRAEEDRRRVEEQRQAEEARRRAEEQRLAEENRRRAEEQRLAEENRRRAEEQRLAEENRRRAEEQRLAEENRRRAEEQRLAEENRRRAQLQAQPAQPPQPVQPVQPPRSPEQQVVDRCQEALSRVAREGTINFKRANFDLEPSSYPTLNRLAAAANQCPTVFIEIEGHTDAEGTDERNDRLSNRRASAVRDYLVRAGVDEGRMAAIGYGSKRSIAPNDTAEGRALNRRIEFTVKMR